MKNRRGFTLIELLIAIILMVILMGSVTVIFMTSSETFNNTQALAAIYEKARFVLDRFTMDLQSCVPFNKGIQKFVMENGVADPNGADPSYAASADSERHLSKAADRITFRAIIPINNVYQTAEITYELKPEAGGAMKTVKSNRPMYVLKRKVMQQNAATGAFDVYDANFDNEYCHGVVSFNLEYYDNTYKFSQLEPSPFPTTDPLGDGLGANDVATPYRAPQIRITLVLIEDEGERRERTFVQQIHIPVGY